MIMKLHFCFLLIPLIVHSECGHDLEALPTTTDNLQLMIQDSEMIDSECRKISDLISSVGSLFYQMGDCASLQCQIRLQADSLNLKKIFDNYINQNLQKYLKNIDGIKLALINIQTQISTENTLGEHEECSSGRDYNFDMIISAIRRRDFCGAQTQLLQNMTLGLTDIVHDVYNGNLKYAENLVEFFNFINNVNDQILGLRLLFDAMTKNWHQYSTVTTTIAYQVSNLLVNSENENLRNLQRRLPNSLQNFKWTSNFNIKNTVIQNTGVLANFMYDKIRRNVILYTDLGGCGADCHWKLIPIANGSFFYIKNGHFHDYIFADKNDYDLKTRRHLVYGISDISQLDDSGRWQLEPIKGTDSFKIKNIKWNEYLYIEDGFVNVNNTGYRQVFTSVDGRQGRVLCKWEIIFK